MNSKFPIGLTLWLMSSAVFAQSVPGFYNPSHIKSGSLPPRKVSGTSDTIQNGKACTLIDFEGAGDLASLPAFDGITLPGWLSIIEYNVGGSGDFAGEPSPVTTAFWLYGNQTQQQIIPPVPASSVSFYYSSYYNVTLTAYDKNGAVVATASGPANFDSDTGVYDYWYPLEVETMGNQIASVTVNGYANYTGIDNLNVCTTIGIDSIEVTQAIQQIQTLSDLDASLMANAEPPVPIIAGKPAVLRVYMDQVDAVANVTVAISGVATETKNVTVQPNCTATSQRALTAPCQSVDFYFTPPMGSWNAHLEVLDSNNNVLDKHDVPVTSRKTNSLRLRSLSICDALDASSNWLCAPASAMTGLTTLLTKIAPTSTFNLEITSGVVRRNYASFTSDPPPGPDQEDKWWDAAVGDVNNMYGLFDAVGDLLSGQRTTYFGMIRPNLAGGTGGMAQGIPSHGAGGRTSALRFTSNTETNVEVVAHETGHTLGLKHTNTDTPQSPAAPPGCYNFASDSSTDWPFADNYIQSNAHYEYGFDVAAKTVLDPFKTFEVMSYCSPRWISPQRYKTMIATLGGGAVSSTSVTQGINPGTGAAVGQGQTIVIAPFWLVSGSIVNNAAVFNPMFQMTEQGDNGPGSGTYSVQVQSAGGAVLYTQHFTPQTGGTETSSTNIQLPPAFSLLIPVTAGAGKIVMLNPGSTVLGTITLGGAVPAVTVTNPTASFPGTGVQTLSWNVVEAGFSSWTSKVLYSPNNGSTWSEIGTVPANTLSADFSTLPGSAPAQALIQVLVSDGVNTGTATSPNFTVLKKQPTVVTINTPVANAVQKAADPVQFMGIGYDPDDGSLTGTSLQWSSSLQGQLGAGSPLLINLLPGVHTITLKATDSDGNFITTTTAITIGGQPPKVTLAVNPLNSVPTTCVQATISATPGQNGAPLSAARYSLNNGAAYTNIPLNQLPFRFIVPGSGFFHLLASATDASGQFNAQDSTLFVSSPCTQATINGVASTTANGSYSTGAHISIQVTFSAAVTVTGTPQLALNSGGAASYTSGSGSNVLTFTYTVGAGDTTQHLDYTSAAALNLNGGTIMASSTAALLTLSAPGSFGSLGYSNSLVINSGAGIGVVNVTSSTPNGAYGTGAMISIQVVFSAAMNAVGTPQLTLNSGGSANYTTGSGTNTLTFIYTVAAGDNSALLDYSSTNALIGSFSAAQLPILTLVTPGTPGSLSANKSIVISTVPTVTNVTSTTPNGVYSAGAVITIKTTFNAAVTVLGTPQLALNSGGLANYTTGSGTSTLTFTYSVAAGQNSARLDFLNTSPFVGGGTVKDASGHAANLTVAAPGVAGSLSANTNIKINTQGAAVGLQFYPIAPCRLVDTRGIAAGFNGIAPFSGPSIAAGGTLNIPVQSASEATANTTPAPCGVIPSTAQAYSINITVVPQGGGAVDYISLWPTGSTQPFVSTLNDPEGLIVANAAVVPAGTPTGGISVFNVGPATADVIIDMNGYFAAPTGLQFYPVAPCRLVDTRGLAAGFNGIAPFSGPSIAAGGTLTIPVQSATEASTNTAPAPCGVIPAAAQSYSLNLTVVPQAAGEVDYVSLWPAGSAKPFVSTLDDPEGLIVANAAIVPAGTPSGGVSVFNAGPAAADVILDMNGYFAPPTTGLQFYPVAPCRLVDTRGIAAGFNGIAPFSGPSIAAGGTLTIPVQSSAELAANTEPAPCGVIPSNAQAYSINLTVVPQLGGAVDYVSLWPAGATKPFVSTLDDPEGLIVANAAIVPAGTPSGGMSVFNAGPATTDVIIDMNGYFAP